MAGINKYAIIYPTCHGGNFLGELLTLGEDCYSCWNNVDLSESTTQDRLTAYISRYTAPGEWISNENFRIVHKDNSVNLDLILAHIHNIKLSNNFKIIVADAFGSVTGVRWAEASRCRLFSLSWGMHHDEDKNYNSLKNSNLPVLRVDMTQFLNPIFPVVYYESLCQQLGIVPVTDSAIRLHSSWYLHRVKTYQEYPVITDSLRQLWSARRQQDWSTRYYNTHDMILKNMAKNLEETYHRVSGPDWPEYNTSGNFFDQLPDWVKQELQNFEINWNNPQTPKLNDHDHTELAIKHGYPVDPYYQYTNVISNLLFIKQNT